MGLRMEVGVNIMCFWANEIGTWKTKRTQVILLQKGRTFFWASREKIINYRILSPTVEWKTVSDFYWKKWRPLHLLPLASRLNGSCSPGSLAHSWPSTGPAPPVNHSLAQSRLMSRRVSKWTSTLRARRKPRVLLGLESHFGPVRHDWLYLHSPKDNWNAQVLPDETVETVGRERREPALRSPFSHLGFDKFGVLEQRGPQTRSTLICLE